MHIQCSTIQYNTIQDNTIQWYFHWCCYCHWYCYCYCYCYCCWYMWHDCRSLRLQRWLLVSTPRVDRFACGVSRSRNFAAALSQLRACGAQPALRPMEPVPPDSPVPNPVTDMAHSTKALRRFCKEPVHGYAIPSRWQVHTKDGMQWVARQHIRIQNTPYSNTE